MDKKNGRGKIVLFKKGTEVSTICIIKSLIDIGISQLVPEVGNCVRCTHWRLNVLEKLPECHFDAIFPVVSIEICVIDQIPKHAHHVDFIVFAETQPAWKAMGTPEGREVLRQHYLWGRRLQQRGVLLFAGPVDLELAGPGSSPPHGQITGLIVLRAESRDEAQTLANEDPFHVAGYRKNVVHSWSLRMVQPEISTAIGQALEQKRRAE